MTIMAQSVKELFSSYSCTATTDYVYNETASSDSGAGWQNSLADNVIVSVMCGTFVSASSLTYRIEGRFKLTSTTYTPAMEITTASITAAQTIPTLVSVTVNPTQLRVGVKRENDDGAASSFFTSNLILTESK